jgi:hypothetical protein
MYLQFKLFYTVAIESAVLQSVLPSEVTFEFTCPSQSYEHNSPCLCVSLYIVNLLL